LFCNCPNPLVNAVLQSQTATFETNGGSDVGSQTVFREYPIKRPSNPVKSGHTFIAWYIDNDTFLEEWDFNAIPNRDITLYAKWNFIGTPVSFDTLTADGSPSQTTTQLTLTFSAAIDGLSADDITLSGVTGVSKGTLGGTGPVYTLPISGFTADGTLSVSVSKAGYYISGSPQSTLIYYYSDPVNQTPVAGDYTIGNLTQTAGNVTAVTITANADKSPGAISNIQYDGSVTVPQAVGSYSVTFDVAAATGWNAASGLSAGTLTVNIAGGELDITVAIDVSELLDKAPNFDSNITLSRSGIAADQKKNVVVTGTYDSISWEIIGMSGSVTGSVATINLDATDERYNSLGWHTVIVKVTVGGKLYQNSFRFRIVELYTTTDNLAALLATLPVNTPTTPYTVTLNVSDLSGIRSILLANSGKYVNLDFSGSSFNSVTDRAFQDSGNTTGITLPSGVTTIGYYAFGGCTELTSINIPVGVTTIGNMAFIACMGLTEITIPESVTTIDDSAFANCIRLTSITIPGSVRSIGDGAFTDCADLTSVTFAAGSDITAADFGDSAFPEGSGGGDNLKTEYLKPAPAGGAGTYTRTSGGSTWAK